MPCDSSYMEPSTHEKNASQVCCLLDELAGKNWKKNWYVGYHPEVYGQHFDLDRKVSELCSKLRIVDATKYSLEMQIWWRDHQKADKEREDAERKKKEALDREYSP